MFGKKKQLSSRKKSLKNLRAAFGRRLQFEPLETRNLLSIASIYVASYGSDTTGDGSNNAPFQSISHAAVEAAPQVQAGNAVDIYIHHGTYHETVIPPTGTSTAPITFEPYGDGKVTIDDADPITNWTNYSGSIYQAPMGWSYNSGDGDQVFVNGQMMNYARWPNSSLDVSNPTKITAATITNPSGHTWVCTSAALDDFPENYWAGATIHTGVVSNSGYATFTVDSSEPGP